MNRIGWIVVLVLLLIVYGWAYVFIPNYKSLQMHIMAGDWRMPLPHFILGALLFGLTASQIYTADW